MKVINEAIIEDLLSKLTLEEKIDMIHGAGIFRSGDVKRLGIPSLIMSDGPMGIRKEFADSDWTSVGHSFDYVTYLPSNSALAATWNIELAYQTGRILGAEARGRGKDIVLAPGINIKRSPLCGRNFEYMSEDPKLIEELVVPLIKGIQENDVAACVKHFAANNQETERLWVDSEVDERTLREIYLPGFRAAVKRADTFTLMTAYNMVNGEHCYKNNYLLSKVLRDEWGFDGAVISDWGGVHDTKGAAEAELDIEMSVIPDFDNYYMAKPLYNAVKNGEIEEKYIDRKIRNILRTLLRLKMLGNDKSRCSGNYNLPEHRQAVLMVAREAITLLKNENNQLPIKREGLKTIAVIGQNAVKLHAGGGGSAEIKALYEISPLMGLKTKLGGNVKVLYAPGYYVPDIIEKELNWQQNSLDELTSGQVDRDPNPSAEVEKQERLLYQEAIELAKNVDEVIYIGGLDHQYDIEGNDRNDMKLPYGQDKLIQGILEVNPKAIIVIVAGSPVEMDSWSKKAKTIVWSYYAGMEGGNALAEVLLGETNPSGKLPEAFPKKYMDCPAHKLGEFGNKDKVKYMEGINVGYRYYDTSLVELEFAFGHGLSYTEFEYKAIKVSEHKSKDADNINILIEVRVKNIGEFDGSEIVQIYIADKQASVYRPAHELKGFGKLFLKAGEEGTITISLDKEAFGFYDEGERCFKVEEGEFEIQAGSSSRDIRLRDTIILSSNYTYI